MSQKTHVIANLICSTYKTDVIVDKNNNLIVRTPNNKVYPISYLFANSMGWKGVKNALRFVFEKDVECPICTNIEYTSVGSCGRCNNTMCIDCVEKCSKCPFCRSEFTVSCLDFVGNYDYLDPRLNKA